MANKFNVVVDAPMTKSQITALEKEINALVLKHVAKIDNGKSILGTKLKINPEWLGIWLKKFATIEALKKAAAFKQTRGI